MASGWGITGNKGRCYDFWMDFSECMSHCREPKDCSLLREDYLECLHHSKESIRRWRKPEPLNQSIRASNQMASGWGITGNKGRCYDFWMDFSECMSHCREPKDCSLLREDYLECLHHSKEFQRRNRVYKEEQRKLRAASRKGEQAVDGTTH
ncbi:hypothetical protein F2Q69_00010238 [Brassica cretica]|uniref:NADH dehydrogenase [ubiquinone] iron-sulfur protein 5-B n=1 Tax=Brassica cretica TaxID=69181 RepID=A0A8S9QU76_BRACR|nr:hypothetical protein F2Q69_00010238 [Brassica cretica]